MDASRRDHAKVADRNLVDILVSPTKVVEIVAKLVALLGRFLFLLSANNRGFRYAAGGLRTLVRGRRTGAFAKPNINRAAGDAADDTFERATGDDVLEGVAIKAFVLDSDVRGVLLLATLQSFERSFASEALDGTAGHAFACIRSSLHATEDLVHTGHSVRCPKPCAKQDLVQVLTVVGLRLNGAGLGLLGGYVVFEQDPLGLLVDGRLDGASPLRCTQGKHCGRSTKPACGGGSNKGAYALRKEVERGDSEGLCGGIKL